MKVQVTSDCTRFTFIRRAGFVREKPRRAGFAARARRRRRESPDADARARVPAARPYPGSGLVYALGGTRAQARICSRTAAAIFSARVMMSSALSVSAIISRLAC